MLSVFHILLHVFEIFLIWALIVVQAKLLQDYEALKGWIEFGMGLDLDYLGKKFEEFKKQKKDT
jgi:hypothetical protein